MEGLIYLDTHVIVWLYAGELSLFPESVRREVENNDLLISPIVRLELQYLWEIEKIKVKPDNMLESLQKSIGLKICDKHFPDVVGEAMNHHWTRDPFDRLIVAQAALGQVGLLTKDAGIRVHYRRAFWG